MTEHANQIAAVTQARWPPLRNDAATGITGVRLAQTARGEVACFMTEQRLICLDHGCTLRLRCRRLVAAWKR